MYEGSSVYKVCIYKNEGRSMAETMYLHKGLKLSGLYPQVICLKVYTAVINILCPPIIQVKNTYISVGEEIVSQIKVLQSILK